jgi:REP element-mobilizing transposase RayT
MKYDPSKHHRRSTRLKGHGYTQAGVYVITLVTESRAHLFGAVVNDEMMLNECGIIALEEWMASGDIRKEIELDAYVIMPNHMHGIVAIVDDAVVASGERPMNDLVEPIRRGIRRMPDGEECDRRSPLPNGPAAKSIGAWVAGYKSSVTRRIRALPGMTDTKVWQRNYHDHIIRNERELNAYRKYIEENPLRWALDREN